MVCIAFIVTVCTCYMKSFYSITEYYEGSAYVATDDSKGSQVVTGMLKPVCPIYN